MQTILSFPTSAAYQLTLLYDAIIGRSFKFRTPVCRALRLWLLRAFLYLPHILASLFLPVFLAWFRFGIIIKTASRWTSIIMVAGCRFRMSFISLSERGPLLIHGISCIQAQESEICIPLLYQSRTTYHGYVTKIQLSMAGIELLIMALALHHTGLEQGDAFRYWPANRKSCGLRQNLADGISQASQKARIKSINNVWLLSANVFALACVSLHVPRPTPLLTPIHEVDEHCLESITASCLTPLLLSSPILSL